MQTSIVKLACEVKRYEWGHSSLIPELLSWPRADGSPIAELWMGAHPAGPSRIEGTGERLDALVAAEPERYLGKAKGGGFPFLGKILGIGKPLSIQCHPNREQARRGFARENAQGVALCDQARNYKDQSPKPELVCALGPFEVLAGFRPMAEVEADFLALADATLASSAQGFDALARASRKGASELSAMILGLEGGLDAHALAIALPSVSHPLGENRSRAIARAAKFFPGDPGLLFFVALELRRINAGEALYLPAGCLHSYLSGLGLELMANSDNVLRCGLTAKHVDASELLSILDPMAEPIAYTASESPRSAYTAPGGELSLERFIAKSNAEFSVEPSGGPEIWFCAEGRGRLWGHEGGIDFLRGDALLLLPTTKNVRLELRGAAYRMLGA